VTHSLHGAESFSRNLLSWSTYSRLEIWGSNSVAFEGAVLEWSERS